MKRLRVTLALLVALMLVIGCLGVKTRENILLPTAQSVYSDIYPDIVGGLLDGKEDGDLTDAEAEVLMFSADALKTALDEGDRLKIASVDWSKLKPWAERGVQDRIDDKKISPAVGPSLFHRIDKFTETLEVLAQRL